MSYEEYSNTTAVANAEGVVGADAKQLGRTLSFVSVTSSTNVASQINIDDYDVLVVHDQMNAPSGTLAQIGSRVGDRRTLSHRFFTRAPLAVVLSGGTKTGEMPALATNVNLITVNSQTNITGALTVLAPADAIGAGVVSPYIPKPSTVTFDTEANGGDVVWVVGQNGAPVVVHKVMP